jgi:hypothetical protein
MLLIGLGTILQIAAGSTVLQTIVDDDKRGRVMSLYTKAAAERMLMEKELVRA